VQATSSGEIDALAQHRRYLYGYAFARLRETHIAEELVQDTLVAALENIACFKGKCAMRTWLTAILKHKIIDWQRREARNPVFELRHQSNDEGKEEAAMDALLESSRGWMGSVPSWSDPEQSLENRRFLETFEHCLNRLPKATARAFYLREIQGMDTDELCRELSISPTNCWVMLHRARMSLRRDLEKLWFLGGEPRMQSA
jgi:RNA polymerase sigma-70 factor, ECF subfamily